MKSSNGMNAIEQADLWYLARAKRNYSLDDHKFSEGMLVENAEREGVLTRLIDDGFFKKYAYENMDVQLGSVFSDYMSTLVQLEDPYSKFGSWVFGLPSGFKQEYINPTIEDLNAVRHFTVMLRVKMGRQNRTLSDEEIDSVFIDSFDGAQGFINFTSAYIDHFPLIAHIGGATKHTSGSEADFIQRSFRAIRDSALYQHTVVLKDLLRGNNAEV